MKKIILLLLLSFSILQSCKESEVKKIESISDTTVVEKAQDPQPAEPSCTVYSADGFIKSEKEAEISICLPEITDNNNLYSIIKCYEVTGSGPNTILLHFKDHIGDDLRLSAENLKKQKFVVDISNLTPKVDIGRPIKFVVYHDNKITDQELRSNANDIFKKGETNADCNPDKTTKDTKESINIPKVCGTGTIKPYASVATK